MRVVVGEGGEDVGFLDLEEAAWVDEAVLKGCVLV